MTEFTPGGEFHRHMTQVARKEEVCTSTHPSQLGSLRSDFGWHHAYLTDRLTQLITPATVTIDNTGFPNPPIDPNAPQAALLCSN